MKPQNRCTLLNPLPWLMLSLVAGVGVLGLMPVQSTFAQSNNTNPSRNSPQNNAQEPENEALTFEMRGRNLWACKPKEKEDEDPKCAEVAKGQAAVIRQANELYQSGDYVNAESLLKQVIERSPKESVAHYKLGEVFYAQEKFSEATVEYQKAIEIDPRYAVAHNSLGMVYVRQNQLDEAMKSWQQALEINPEFAEARRNLGLGLWDKGNKEAAIVNLKQARDLLKEQGKYRDAAKVERFLQENGVQ